MKTPEQSRHGAALLGLIGAIVVVTLIAAGLLMLFNAQLIESTESAASSHSFQAAETGLSIGRASLFTNLLWYRSVPYTITGSIGRATFRTVVNTGGTAAAFITSTGSQSPAKWTSIWDGAGTWNGTGALARAIMVYRDAGTNLPMWRAYTQLKEVCGELTATAAADSPGWQRIVAGAGTNEFLLVSQDASGWIRAQACTGNTWFANTLLNGGRAISASASRAFDVAYENLTGRGIVVYSTNGVTPQYRIWNGANWSAPAAVDVGANGTIRWVRLVAKPNSDEIMALFRWQNGNDYSSAAIWDGAAWGSTQALENSNSGAEIDYETMDAAYSSTTGLVVYINGATATARKTPKCRTWNGAAWSAESSLGALSAAPRWIRLEFSIDGTDAFAAILNTGGRLNGAHWTGTWGAYNDFGTANGVRMETAAYRDFDIAWGRQTNAIMVIYCEANNTTRSYMFQPQGGAAAYGLTPDLASHGQWSVLRTDPFAPEFVYLSLDDANAVNVLRWNGSSWQFMQAVEASSDLNYCSIDMAFRNDNP